MAFAASSVSARWKFRHRQSRFAACAFEVGGGTVERGAIAALVDDEQQVALADLGAFLVGDALDVAADARPELDGLDGAHAARELVPRTHFLRKDPGDADFGWRWHDPVRCRGVVVTRERENDTGRRKQQWYEQRGADKFWRRVMTEYLISMCASSMTGETWGHRGSGGVAAPRC
jgi:hypothetical protein